MDIGLLLLSFLVVTYAQIRLSIVYSKYKKQDVVTNLTGREVTERILAKNGINDVTVNRVSGNLTDNFNNSTRTVNLSEDIYDGRSIASVAVAAHECGHAIQYKVGYSPIKLRNKLVPIVNIGNTIGYIVIIIGLITAYYDLFLLGIILSCFALAFQIVTLPVEFNASNRARNELMELGIVEEREKKGVKKMLKAAAFTYVAGLFSSVLQMLRLVAMFGGNRRRR